MTEGSDYRACLDVYLDTSGGILYLRKLSLFYMSYSYFLSSAIYKADLSVFEVYKSSYLSCWLTVLTSVILDSMPVSLKFVFSCCHLIDAGLLMSFEYVVVSCLMSQGVTPPVDYLMGSALFLVLSTFAINPLPLFVSIMPSSEFLGFMIYSKFRWASWMKIIRSLFS